MPEPCRWLTVGAMLVAVAGCSRDGTGLSRGVPARIEAVSDLVQTGTVATAVASPVTVKVRDADNRPVSGAIVTFAITHGGGFVTSRVTHTDAAGQASTAWTLGTVAGANEVIASVDGLAATLKFAVTAHAGPASHLQFSPQFARILNGSDSTRILTSSADAYGNVAGPPPRLVPRDPTLVSVDSLGVVRALRRGDATYLVATAGSISDSALVIVLAPGQSICTGVASPMDLAVGQVVTDVAGAGTCIHASTAGAEYALIPFFNSTVASATRQIEVKGLGLDTARLQPSRVPLPLLAMPSRTAVSMQRDEHFELTLRSRERANLPRYVDGAREWFRNRAPASASGLSLDVSASRSLTVGDLVQLNTNANSYCDSAIMRTGRVAAITSNAIVIADTANPSGGFTDAEYQSIGTTFDTLVNAVDTAAFGAPSDIDNNGRVIMFFTRDVNAMTPRGANAVVLGFFYSRDLLPKTSSSGNCPGSNVSEMFYLLVPDPQGIVSDARTKAQVVSFTNGTVAHEYQHLINASRRMYVNATGAAQEEVWLNEGLSHIAEELNFFRAAGLAPRQNVDSAALTLPRVAAAYPTFAASNVARFRRYLPSTENQGPIGSSPDDDDLATRGAIWNFLRFAADQQPGTDDGTVWYRLVNTRLAGVDNLTHVFGSGVMDLMRDWAISVYADDHAPGLDPRFSEPSWNLRSAMAQQGFAYPLLSRALFDGSTTTVLLAGTSASFLRFTVPSGADALLTVTSNGQPLPSAISLSVIRIK